MKHVRAQMEDDQREIERLRAETDLILALIKAPNPSRRVRRSVQPRRRPHPLLQSSTFAPGMRLKSLVLQVTTMKPLSEAWAANRQSILPMRFTAAG